MRQRGQSLMTAALLLVALLASATASIVVGSVRPAQAMATITVTTAGETVDGGDGLCSLREAITSANTNLVSGAAAGECAAGSPVGTDTIEFASSYFIALGGTKLPAITENLTIDGASAGVVTISGSGTSRLFDVDGAVVTFDRIDMTAGNSGVGAGAIRIVNGSAVTVTNAQVTGNTGTSVGAIAVNDGSSLKVVASVFDFNSGATGAIDVRDQASSVTITGSTIAFNTGGAEAGGLRSLGLVTLTNSVVDNNTGGHGGVFFDFVGSGVITNSSVSDNTANASNGAAGISGGTSLELVDSTVANNTGWAAAVRASDSMTIINSTISGNSGGGSVIAGVVADLGADIFHATIVDNDGVGLYLTGNAPNPNPVTIGASVIAGNADHDVRILSVFPGPLVTEGYNVIGEMDDPASLIDFDGPNDIVGVVDPLLAPLTVAGLHQTHTPLDGSPVVDRVSGAVSQGQTADQIGTARPQGANKDTGAIEALAAAAAQCDGKLPTIDMNVNGGDGTGTSSADVILGTELGDVINGFAGDDTICGDFGDDVIRGGAGADVIHGGDGGDDLKGGGGADEIDGNAGADDILGQGGTDTIRGGADDDIIAGQGAADEITGGGGADIIDGQNGADVLNGGAEGDVLRGQTGPDIFTGGDGDDEMFGGEGADTLYGGAGIDKCSGNTGPDSAEAATCEQTPGIELLF